MLALISSTTTAILLLQDCSHSNKSSKDIATIPPQSQSYASDALVRACDHDYALAVDLDSLMDRADLDNSGELNMGEFREMKRLLQHQDAPLAQHGHSARDSAPHSAKDSAPQLDAPRTPDGVFSLDPAQENSSTHVSVANRELQEPSPFNWSDFEAENAALFSCLGYLGNVLLVISVILAPIAHRKTAHVGSSSMKP